MPDGPAVASPLDSFLYSAPRGSPRILGASASAGLGSSGIRLRCDCREAEWQNEGPPFADDIGPADSDPNRINSSVPESMVFSPIRRSGGDSGTGGRRSILDLREQIPDYCRGQSST